jgi:hypothetical protein
VVTTVARGLEDDDDWYHLRLTDSFAPNPLNVSVKFEPTVPDMAERRNAGVTVNCADAVLPALPMPVTM